MIIVKQIDSSNIRGQMVTLFADTKSEVPSTGAATVSSLGEQLILNPGDVVYTADFNAAILKSNDQWKWKS